MKTKTRTHGRYRQILVCGDCDGVLSLYDNPYICGQCGSNNTLFKTGRTVTTIEHKNILGLFEIRVGSSWSIEFKEETV